MILTQDNPTPDDLRKRRMEVAALILLLQAYDLDDLVAELSQIEFLLSMT